MMIINRHPYVKVVIVTLNVLIGTGLFMFLLTMIDKKEYAEVVLEGPVFFKDLFLVVAVSVGPIVIGTLVLKDLNRGFLPAMLVVLGILCGATAYFTLPSVRQERLRTSLFDVELAIADLESNRAYYHENPEYYRYLMNELHMFHTMFDTQIRFISNSEHIQDQRSHRVPMFFGLLTSILFVNAGWLVLGRTADNDS